MLDEAQAIAPARQPGPAQDPLYRAGRHADGMVPPQMGGQPARTPGRPGQSQSQHQALDVRGHLPEPSGARLLPARMQAVRPVAFEARQPTVEQRAGNAGFAAGGAHVTELVRSAHVTQASGKYAVVQGIGRPSPSGSLGRVVTLGRIRQMALCLFRRWCQHLCDSIHFLGCLLVLVVVSVFRRAETARARAAHRRPRRPRAQVPS
jgi:hypothetical protein